MSVPLWWNADGLPIGVHFLGRFGDEATLFRLAAQLESARPWTDRWPAVSVAAPAHASPSPGDGVCEADGPPHDSSRRGHSSPLP